MLTPKQQVNYNLMKEICSNLNIEAPTETEWLKLNGKVKETVEKVQREEEVACDEALCEEPTQKAFDFHMGQAVVDNITGFRGLVVALCAYIDGTHTYEVQPQCDDNTSKIPQSEWISEKRLSEVI